MWTGFGIHFTSRLRNGDLWHPLSDLSKSWNKEKIGRYYVAFKKRHYSFFKNEKEIRLDIYVPGRGPLLLIIILVWAILAPAFVFSVCVLVKMQVDKLTKILKIPSSLGNEIHPTSLPGVHRGALGCTPEKFKEKSNPDAIEPKPQWNIGNLCPPRWNFENRYHPFSCSWSAPQ